MYIYCIDINKCYCNAFLQQLLLYNYYTYIKNIYIHTILYIALQLRHIIFSAIYNNRGRDKEGKPQLSVLFCVNAMQSLIR